MVRRFVTLDGEIEAEEEWRLRPTDRCFYCDQYLMLAKGTPCPEGLNKEHDFITLVGR